MRLGHEFSINENSILLEAIKKMDRLDVKLLLVLDAENLFKGLISIGDIQRYLIRHQTLEHSVKNAQRKDVRVGNPKHSRKELQQQMVQYRMEFMPIVNEHREIVEVLFWEDIINKKPLSPQKKLSSPVVIMAGGKGTRLKPITNIVPKPLIPIGDKAIIELIIQNFQQAGCNEFYLSVNYKAEMIAQYLKEVSDGSYKVSFFTEDKPLGTAGSLNLIKDKIKQTFFVSNCDILIDQDYSEVYNFHKKNEYDVTIVAALKHYHIPYGILEVGENGKLLALKEKPSLTYQVNAGLYILEPTVFKYIPDNEFFHITDLMEKVQAAGGSVGVFPVSEKSWSDIGEWPEYNATMKKMGIRNSMKIQE